MDNSAGDPQGVSKGAALRTETRSQRLIDALRILPIAGLFFVLLPGLWQENGAINTVAALVYLFVLWALLVIMSYWLSRSLARQEPDEQPPT